MPENEADKRKRVLRLCREKGVDFIRGEINSPHPEHINPLDLPYAREWLNWKDRRHKVWTFWMLAISAGGSFLAAVAALVTAILAYRCSH